MVSGRLTALAAFVRAQPKLFYTHTQSVVMLGGALKPSGASNAAAATPPMKGGRGVGGVVGGGASDESAGAWASEEGRFLTPDPTAQNVALDAPAAEFVFRMCQRLTVPLVVVSRHAANACWLPRSLYDAIARSGAPVGVQLREQATRRALILAHHLLLR